MWLTNNEKENKTLLSSKHHYLLNCNSKFVVVKVIASLSPSGAFSCTGLSSTSLFSFQKPFEQIGGNLVVQIEFAWWFWNTIGNLNYTFEFEIFFLSIFFHSGAPLERIIIIREIVADYNKSCNNNNTDDDDDNILIIRLYYCLRLWALTKIA